MFSFATKNFMAIGLHDTQLIRFLQVIIKLTTDSLEQERTEALT